MDYVTNKENYFINAGIRFNKVSEYTIEELFDLLKIFQIYIFFESDTILRIEHIKYIETELQDNAVSLTLDNDENEWSYLEEILPLSEELRLDEDDDNTDPDFHFQSIVYTQSSVGDDTKFVSNTFTQFTDIDKYISDSTEYEDLDFLMAGNYQHIEEFKESGVSVTDTYKNDFTYTEVAAIPTETRLLSNDINFDDEFSDIIFDCFVYLDLSGATSCTACFRDRSTGSIISDTQALSNGDNTFTLTSNGGDESDAVFCIYFTAAQFDTVAGYATVRTQYNATYAKPERLASEIGVNSSDYKPNGPFSQANIVDNWWGTNRPTNSGTINGVAKSFTDSQRSIQRETKPRYYPNDINMRYGINDGTRIAKIKTYKRDLDTDFVTFTLVYAEDE